MKGTNCEFSTCQYFTLGCWASLKIVLGLQILLFHEYCKDTVRSTLTLASLVSITYRIPWQLDVDTLAGSQETLESCGGSATAIGRDGDLEIAPHVTCCARAHLLIL